MPFAVTIVAPPGYQHSLAFLELAETVHYGLRALGHDSVLTTDGVLPGRRHVVLGANLLATDPIPLAPDAILYNLEQIAPGSPWLKPEMLALFRRHPVWDYSARNADALVALGLPRPQVVPIGYVPQLTRIAPAAAEDIDVLFYGTLNERRARVLEALRARGANVVHAFGKYAGERDALIARAKLCLNVHHYDAKVFEIVRVSYLLANARAVVSERGADVEDERAFEPGVAFAPYDRLVDRCLALLAAPDERRRLAQAGFELMRARSEPAYLAAALSAA
jgi:hypothetical protein